MNGYYRSAAIVAPTLALALTLVAACGGKTGDSAETAQTPLLTAATIGEQSILTANEFLSQAPYAAANLQDGENQARICTACHSMAKGGANMIGPKLYGFFGKQVGTVEGFGYSKAIESADFVWTPRVLDAWLVQPGRFLPGNRMSFAGVGNADDRADLIAFLLQATDDSNDDNN